jgi:hypothetical protein
VIRAMAFAMKKKVSISGLAVARKVIIALKAVRAITLGTHV